MSKIIIPILFLIGLASLACIDEIPFELEETKSEFLIIDAEIRAGEPLHKIVIKINSPEATDFQPDFPVNDAEVKIIENGSEEFRFITFGKGVYQNGLLNPTVGNNYQLVVNYKDTEYRSSVETLYPPINAQSSYTINTTELFTNSAGRLQQASLIDLFIDADLPTDENVYLRFRTEGTYEYREIGSQSNLNPVTCYVDELIDLDNISIASNLELENGALNDHFVIRKNADFRFAYKYCFKIRTERISEEAFEFWSLIQDEYSRTGDIFETPPGILRGNITEQSETDITSIGLFSMISTDTLNHLVLREEASSPAPQCRPWPRPPGSCYNCLLLPNSTLIKPECFE